MNARTNILSKIHRIIYDEGRPFSYKDFVASNVIQMKLNLHMVL